MTPFRLTPLLLLTQTLLWGCGSSGGDDSGGLPDYLDQPVTGKINDEAWDYVSGRATVKAGQSITIELYADNIGDVCADLVPLSEGRWLEFVVPDAKGETIHQSEADDFYAHVVVVGENSGSFTSPSKSAKTLIVNRSEDMVVGKFYFISNLGKNELNGTFQVPTCAFE